MKKVITLFLICILIIFNTVSCGFDLNNKSETILEKTEKMAENVYDAIKNHDSEQLKEQFCERLQPGKETAVDKIYEYIDGEIETLETDFAPTWYFLFMVKSTLKNDILGNFYANIPLKIA